MTTFPRGTGLGPNGAEILFPFLAASSLLALGDDDDPSGAGRTWDVGAPVRVRAGHGTHPQTAGTLRDAGEMPVVAMPARALSWAEAPGMGRLKSGVATEPLHGLPAWESPCAQARRDLREVSDRDWLDRATQADAFIFLPAPGSRDPADGAGSPAMPLGTEAWFDLLILQPLSDSGPDFGPEPVFLPDHGPFAPDHALL